MIADKPTTNLTWHPGGAQGVTPDFRNGQCILVAFRTWTENGEDGQRHNETWDHAIVLVELTDGFTTLYDGWQTFSPTFWDAVMWWTDLDAFDLPVPAAALSKATATKNKE